MNDFICSDKQKNDYGVNVKGSISYINTIQLQDYVVCRLHRTFLSLFLSVKQIMAFRYLVVSIKVMVCTAWHIVRSIACLLPVCRFALKGDKSSIFVNDIYYKTNGAGVNVQCIQDFHYNVISLQVAPGIYFWATYGTLEKWKVLQLLLLFSKWPGKWIATYN